MPSSSSPTSARGRGFTLSFADPRVALNVLDPGSDRSPEHDHRYFQQRGNDCCAGRRIRGLPRRSAQGRSHGKYIWRSKMFKTDYLSNLGAAKVYWTPPYDTPPGDTVFRMYAAASSQQIEDGLWFRFEQKLAQSGQMFRLPSWLQGAVLAVRGRGLRLHRCDPCRIVAARTERLSDADSADLSVDPGSQGRPKSLNEQ